MASQPPAQALASHLISQTLASVGLLEQLSLISADDAAAIRARLPNAYGTFPQLAGATPAAASTATPASPGASNTYGANTHTNVAAVTSQMNAMAVSPAIQAAAQRQAPGLPNLPPRQSVPATTDTQPRARALWDYAGTEADDLQFRQGDIIVIDEEVNDQWYRGRIAPPGGAPTGKAGLFPSNYVEKLAPGSHVPGYVPPATPAYGTSNSYYQAPAEKATYGAPQYQPPEQQQQQPTTIVVQQDDEKKKGRFGKYGGQLGTAAVSGLGFGAGSAVASNIVNAIL